MKKGAHMKKIFLIFTVFMTYLHAEGPLDKIFTFLGVSGNGWLQSLSLKADDNMNFQKNDGNPEDSGPNSSVLDVILIFDEGAVKDLKKLTGQAYFEKKEQLMRDHKGKIQILSHEITPGFRKDNIPVTPEQSEIAGILVFARYFAKGDHRATMDPKTKRAEIHLQKEKFDIIDLDKQK